MKIKRKIKIKIKRTTTDPPPLGASLACRAEVRRKAETDGEPRNTRSTRKWSGKAG